MPHLNLRLFGGFYAETSDGRPIHLPTDKIRGLLAYLLLAADHPQRREHLAALLWPEWEEAAGLRNLRQSFYRLRQSLEKAAPGLFDHLCTVTRQDVTLHSHALGSDVTDFWLALSFSAQQPDHLSLPASHTKRAALVKAVEGYQGEFLAGLAFADAPEFELWLAGQRQRHHLALLSALEQLAAHSLADGDFSQAYTYGERQLALEPWREIAHRQVMRALTASGQRSAALEQFHRCRTLLAEELGVDPEPETFALFQALLEPTALPSALTTPHPSPWPARHANNLPAALSSFVGREAETEQICQLVTHQRLVTLTGAGGSGKTRLALECGRGLLPCFSDGVWLVELADLRDPERVIHAIANALGVAEQEGRSLRHLLADFLTSRRLLLILDNCEHLLSACAAAAEFLLTRCPELSLLTTSREALGIPGEHHWPVLPLSLPTASPDAGAETDLLGILSAPAVRLFLDRAVAHRPTFALTAENAADIVRICRRLDGMPLALELAAARVRSLSPARIARLLDERFSLLTGGSRTALPRQQTLRALIDWSYDLLAPTEQTLFQRMAVFAGSASLEAVEDICADAFGGALSTIGDASVLELLLRLVDKSMIWVSDGVEGNRYGMLETIRSYAQEKLRTVGEEEEMAWRHVRYLARLATAAEPELVGGNEAAWLDRLGREDDNLHAALQWAFAPPTQFGRNPSSLGIRLAGCLVYYWDAFSRLDDSRRWLHVAWENVDRRTPPLDQARLASGLGTVAWHSGQYNEARGWHQKAVRLYEQAEDGRGIALSLHNLAVQYEYAGDWSRSYKLLQEAIRVAETSNHAGIMGLTLSSLGNHYNAVQRYDEAGPLLEESSTLLRRSGSTRLLGYVLTSLLEYHLARGQISQCQGIIIELDAVARRCGDRILHLACTFSQARMLRAQARFPEALAASADALCVYRDRAPDANFTNILESFAISLVMLGRDEAGLLLLAFCESRRVAGQESRPPIYQREVDAALAVVCARLPAQAVAEVKSQAASLTTQGALTFALGLSGAPDPAA